jgi:hypothetical protein
MGPRTRAPRCLLRIALRNCYAVAPLRLLPKSSLCAIRSLLRDMCANKSPSRDLCAISCRSSGVCVFRLLSTKLQPPVVRTKTDP